MSETASQRAERRRRAAEVAEMRFDGLDDVRLAIRRRKAKLAAPKQRDNAAAAKRRAREIYAEQHGITVTEMDRLASSARAQGDIVTRVYPLGTRVQIR